METKDLIHEELKRLKTELEKLETAAREFQKLGESGGQLAITVQTLSDGYSKHISTIEDLIATRITSQTESLLSARNDLDEKLNEIKKDALEKFDEPIKKVSALSSQIAGQIEVVGALIEKLEKVDFPIRLDKLDATTAGINQGVQNQISKLDQVEARTLEAIKEQTTQIKSLNSLLKESFNTLTASLDTKAQELMAYQKTSRIILIGGILVILIAMIPMILKLFHVIG
jgi:hypothetical protein